MLYEITVPFGVIQAQSYRELLEKVRFEKEFWGSLGPLVAHDSGAQSNAVVKWLNTPLGIIHKQVNGWAKHITTLESTDGRKFADTYGDFKKAVETDIDLPPASFSNLASVVKTQSNSSRRDLALAIMVGTVSERIEVVRHFQSQPASVSAYLGYATALSNAANLFLPVGAPAGSQETLKNELAVARQMLDQLDKGITEAQEAWAEAKLNNEAFEASTSSRMKQLHLRATKAMRSIIKTSRNTDTDRQSRFESLLSAFEVHMSLKHPVQLWETQKKEHETSSLIAQIVFYVGSAALVGAAIVLVVCFGDWIASAFINEGCVEGSEDACKRISAKGPLVISAIFLGSTVCLWFLRLQMKIYLSERHLVLDARERMAFAETYLSLIQDDNVSRDNEQVVLQSLFRPTQDGIIKDDIGPDFSAAGMLSRTLAGQGK